MRPHNGPSDLIDQDSGFRAEGARRFYSFLIYRSFKA